LGCAVSALSPLRINARRRIERLAGDVGGDHRVGAAVKAKLDGMNAHAGRHAQQPRRLSG